MNLTKIKLENVLTLLYIPIGLINLTRANADFFITALAMQLLLIIGIYAGTKTTRKELKEAIKSGCYEEEIEDFKRTLASLLRAIRTIEKIFKGIKKEVIGSKLETTKLKDAF